MRKKQTRRSRAVKFSATLRDGESVEGWMLTGSLNAIERDEFPFTTVSVWPSPQATKRPDLGDDLAVSSIASISEAA